MSKVLRRMLSAAKKDAIFWIEHNFSTVKPTKLKFLWRFLFQRFFRGKKNDKIQKRKGEEVKEREGWKVHELENRINLPINNLDCLRSCHPPWNTIVRLVKLEV